MIAKWVRRFGGYWFMVHGIIIWRVLRTGAYCSLSSKRTFRQWLLGRSTIITASIRKIRSRSSRSLQHSGMLFSVSTRSELTPLQVN